MHLPKKIYPDNLIESVVEVKYNSELPFEVLIGQFFNAFDEDYTYTNRSLPPPKGKNRINGINQSITIKTGISGLFYNDKISLMVSANAFVFNCLTGYIGWNEYKHEIEKGLKAVISTGHIQQFTRVGLRYISQYSEKDLKECIRYNFTFGLPNIQSETSALRTEFEYKGSKIILKLSNKVPSINQHLTTKQVETIKTSLIDIDVITDKLNLKDLEQLLTIIEENHTKEKEIFFGMLTEDFLKSLNPEY